MTCTLIPYSTRIAFQIPRHAPLPPPRYKKPETTPTPGDQKKIESKNIHHRDVVSYRPSVDWPDPRQVRGYGPSSMIGSKAPLGGDMSYFNSVGRPSSVQIIENLLLQQILPYCMYVRMYVT